MISGPSDAMDDIVIIFRLLLPEICVELRTFGRVDWFHSTIVPHKINLNHWFLQKMVQTSSIVLIDKMQLNIRY